MAIYCVFIKFWIHSFVDFSEIPVEVFCTHRGLYRSTIILTAPDDVRIFRLECNASESTESSLIEAKDIGNKVERFLPDPTVFITENFDCLRQKDVSLNHNVSWKQEIMCNENNMKSIISYLSTYRPSKLSFTVDTLT